MYMYIIYTKGHIAYCDVYSYICTSKRKDGRGKSGRNPCVKQEHTCVCTTELPSFTRCFVHVVKHLFLI